MLQDVVNLANRGNVRAGNPDLLPTYMHDLSARYIYTEPKLGSTLSVNLGYSGSPNYISDSLVTNRPDFIVAEGETLGEGNQYSKPINSPGYRKLTGKFLYSIPISFIKSNFNVSAAFSLADFPAVVNGERSPFSRDSYSANTRITSNVSENLDFTVGYTYSAVLNELMSKSGIMDNNYDRHRVYMDAKWIFGPGITLTAAARYERNKSRQKRFDDELVFCDLFLGKQFFRDKSCELSIGVSDLLDAGSRLFYHSVSAAGIGDTERTGIGRYVSVQFVYHLRSFKD